MELNEIKKRIRRTERDYIMPIYLPFLPAILMLFSGGLLIGSIGLYTLQSETTTFPPEPGTTFDISMGIPIAAIILIITAVASLLLGIYVLYKWIDRRNRHFKRVKLLYEDVIDFLEEKGAKSEARTAKRTLREMESETDEKSPVLWMVLAIIFQPVILYILHFLTKDFYKHEQKENFLLIDMKEAIEAAGGKFELTKYDAIKDRNTILYIILTILTLGLFGLYWIYTITDDPNNHFKQSSALEEDLLNSLETF